MAVSGRASLAAQPTDPSGNRMRRFKTDALAGLIICHALAALAFLPWFFSWTGVVLLGVGMFVFGVLGLNLGFHRFITHRSFSCPRWLERTFAVQFSLGCG